ncbi:MAG: ABC-F family ATP-binding cassette domain-containing protein [Candidatus Dormibacteria bacterium]
MAQLNLQDVSAGYGAVTLFEHVSFQLDPGQRLAIVGPNGAGKTTLLRLITGQLTPTQGRVERQRGLRIAVLNQVGDDPEGATVLEQALLARGDILEMRHRLRELEVAMATAGDDLDRVLHEYGDLQNHYQHLGGYTLEETARKVLGGLGLRDELLERAPLELSGGQRRRLEVAALLLQDADVLLLDEPTNHLDLPALEWLEGFLAGAPQSMLLVSHDRRFLDNVATSVVELENGRGYSYPGNYSRFVKLRAERRERQLKEWQTQQEHIRHTEDFIRRYRAGQRAREAAGRQKLLDRLERVDRPPDPDSIRVRFSTAASGRIVMKSPGLTAGYDGRAVITVPAFTITAGDRLAIVGSNGSGKSTLLDTFRGALPAIEGRTSLGSRVNLSHYDQHLGALDGKATLLQVLQEGHDLPAESARAHLARVGLSGDDVFKQVGQLSGGEQSRLKLARLMLDDSNFLMLDEPTNHLDIDSQEVLEEALRAFPGTLVFVTHDRALVDALATTTWYIVDGAISLFPPGRAPEPAPRRAAVIKAPSDPRVTQRRDRALGQQATQKLRREVREIEGQVSVLEQQLKELEIQLADPALYAQGRQRELGERYDSLQSAVQDLYSEWEMLAEELGRREPADPT